MNEQEWQELAKIVALPQVADYLIERAKKTPYFDLEGYMNRNWLFNPYPNRLDLPDAERGKMKQYSDFPSIRVHHILRADLARHPHDHPWNARTIILKGWYVEDRVEQHIDGSPLLVNNEPYYKRYRRVAGDTATLNFGEYHNIKEVSPGGVHTLFITEEYQGTWGFLVDGVKVPWREYTNEGAA